MDIWVVAGDLSGWIFRLQQRDRSGWFKSSISASSRRVVYSMRCCDYPLLHGEKYPMFSFCEQLGVERKVDPFH